MDRGQSGSAYAKDRVGFCGSHLSIAYSDHRGTEVMKYYAVTGFGEENQFTYSAV